MTRLTYDYDVINDTPAAATPVEANFNRTEQFVNQELVNRDGSVEMTGPLKLYGDPIQPLDAATKQYVDAVLPIGIIMMFGGAANPPGGKWALCNGAELESAAYPVLFTVIGSNFGGSAGRFNLPDLRGRTGVGVEPGTTGLALGNTGGSRTTTVPKHDHAIDHDHAAVLSGTESAWHTHTGVDHLHGVQGWTGDISANHAHDIGESVRYNPFVPTRYFQTTGGGGFPTDTYHGGNALQSNGHAHYFSGTSGAADRSLETGNQSVLHSHTVDVPAYAGRSGMTGDDPVVGALGNNMQPYQVLNFLMRVS